MKISDNPFPREQNMVDARLLKGKAKILTSAKAKKVEIVNLKIQISADEYREIKRHHDQHQSRYEQGETSKASAIRPHVTSHILLNKWQ
jgi:hypothetical protein